MYTELQSVWKIHNEKTNLLISHLNTEELNLRARSRSKTILAQLIHLHNTRVHWIEHIKPDIKSGVQKIIVNDPSVDLLQSKLSSSTRAIAELINYADQGEKIRGIRGSLTTFICYLISHESHHRGQIMSILKQHKVKLDKSLQYGIWEWR